jgi:NAD(P)H-hydrate epimerase
MPASPERVVAVPRLPPRMPDAHKGDFGRVLIAAGSRGMTGAAVLCATAALRGGAGLVRVAVPAAALPLVAPGNPCYMTGPLPDEDGKLAAAAAGPLVELLRESTAAGVGPGLGRTPGVSAAVRAALEQTDLPLALDADGLNALPSPPDLLKRRRGPLVLTPHPGEFARLTGSDVAAVQVRREAVATRFAADHGVVLVLKGHRTVVTDGRRVYLNTTGNPGMATGGSGDVLTGLVAALLGQKLEAFAAAQLGVYLHGLAGDLAREELGETALIASDILDYLPRAFQSHDRPGPRR